MGSAFLVFGQRAAGNKKSRSSPVRCRPSPIKARLRDTSFVPGGAMESKNLPRNTRIEGLRLSEMDAPQGPGAGRPGPSTTRAARWSFSPSRKGIQERSWKPPLKFQSHPKTNHAAARPIRRRSKRLVRTSEATGGRVMRNTRRNRPRAKRHAAHPATTMHWRTADPAL